MRAKEAVYYMYVLAIRCMITTETLTLSGIGEINASWNNPAPTVFAHLGLEMASSISFHSVSAGCYLLNIREVSVWGP